MLTQQQIDMFKMRARQAGYSDAQITQEIQRKQQEVQSGIQQPAVQPTIQTNASTPQVQMQGQQPEQESFTSSFLKTILDPVVKVGRDAVGSGLTLAGAGTELASRVFDKDNSNKVGDDLIKFGLAVMSDEGREAATSSLQSDPFGTKALKVGTKRGATTASYMVPGGKTVKGAVGTGMVSGFLDTAGRDDVNAQDLVTGTLTGGIASGGLKYGGQQLVKGLNKGAVNVNKLLTKLANPFSEQFDDEVAKLATTYNVDLPVSAQTSSNFVKQTEAIAQKSMFGGGITKKIIKSKEQVDEIVQTMTSELAKDPDKINVGNVIKEGFEQFESSFNKTKTELYNAVPNTVKKTPATLDDTQATLKNIIDAKELSAAPNTNVSYYKTISENLFGENKKPTYEVLKNTRTTIWEKLKNFNDPIATGDRGSLERLYAALSDDLDNTIKMADENAYQVIKKADDYYSENIAMINSKVGRLIKDSDPEKLIDGLVKPNSETQIKLVKNLVGEEGTKEIQEGFVNKLFTDSVDTRTGNIKLSKLKTQLKKYSDSTISELLEPTQYAKIQEVVQTLDDVEKLQKAINRGAKPAEGSQTAFLSNLIGTLGVGVYNPMLALKYVGSSYAGMKLLNSKTGQKLLTEGLGDVKKIPGLDVELSQTVNTLIQRLATLSGVASVQADKESEVFFGPFPQDKVHEQNPAQTPNVPKNGTPPTGNENIFDTENSFNQDSNNIPQQPSNVFNGMSKQEVLTLATSQGATKADLEEISSVYDLLTAKEPKSADSYTQGAPKQYTSDQLYTGIMNAYAAGDEASAKYLEKMYALSLDRDKRMTKEDKPTAQATAGAAVSQLRTLFGRGNASNVGTDNDLALGGKGGKLAQGAGKVKGAIKEYTDADYSNDLQIFRNQAEQTLGLFTQAFGSGTPQDAEAQRLLSSIPGPSTPDDVAKAWFNNLELLILAAGGVPSVQGGTEL